MLQSFYEVFVTLIIFSYVSFFSLKDYNTSKGKLKGEIKNET